MKKRLDVSKTEILMEVASNLDMAKVKTIKFKKSKLWIKNECSLHHSKYGEGAKVQQDPNSKEKTPLPKDTLLFIATFQCGCMTRYEFVPENVALEEEQPQSASKTPPPSVNPAVDELAKKLKYYRHFEIPGRSNTYKPDEAKEKVWNIVKALCQDEEFGVFEEGSGEDMKELSGILENL